MSIRQRRCAGFSLLEVLITILVISIGLLGLAALQAFSLKANQSANFRTQATSLAYMIVDRMRAHGGGPLNTTTAYYGEGSDARARADLGEWRARITAQLPGGVGTITFPGNTIVVSISWTDARWALSDAQRCTPDIEDPQTCKFSLTTTL